MSGNNFLSLFLRGALPNLPIMLATMLCLAGVMINWGKGRTSSVLALLSFGTLFVLSFAGPLIRSLINMTVQSATMDERLMYLTIYSVLENILRALAYVGLLIAVYIGRQPAMAAQNSAYQ